MIILGYDTSRINWYLVLYVVSSIFFLVYGTNAVYPTGQIRGVIFGIGTALVLIYFGLRWFTEDKAASSNWPPVINMCPDYLTYIPSMPTSSTNSTVKAVCVDMLGVSKNGALQKTFASDLGGLKSDNANKVIPWTSADITTANMSKDIATITTICNSCQSAGITWEGVFDGETCISLNSYNKSKAAVEQCLLSI